MDNFSKEKRSEVMRRIRSQDTQPEMAVRRLVHGMGFRYRLHAKDLPGKPDLVFRGRKKVIFVHGCFWHQHSSPNCSRNSHPKSNTEYWGTKLEKNAIRDRKNLKSLKCMGWKAFVVWECEIKELEMLKSKIARFLEG